MSQGILNNPECKTFYEKINERILCIKCREERSLFSHKDKKHNSSYSNMIPGFSSSHLQVPIDLMIIAEAHGGGRADAFRNQRSLQIELEHLEQYYLQKEISKFHQSEMKKFLLQLNDLNLTWVFTDLVKCFVWQDRKDELDCRTNFKKAEAHCSKYLQQQLDFLRPKLIISLGGKVSSYFKIKSAQHGTLYERAGRKIIHCTFPSRNTADHWARNKEWSLILERLSIEFTLSLHGR